MTTTPAPLPVLEDPDKEERAIQSFGLNYKPVSIKREEIDLAHSTTFNARFETRVNDERVLTYADLMSRGVRFPRISVFFDRQLRKYSIISGVHRVSAHAIADLSTPIDAFEVIVNPPGDHETMERIADLGMMLNNTGPLGLSKAETLQFAIRALHNRDVDAETVAERYGLRADEVENAYEVWLLDTELQRFGLDPSVISRKGDKRAVLSLPSQAWMHEVQKLLINFIDPKTGHPILSNTMLQEIARDLRVEKDEVRRQDIIKEARAKLSEGKPRRRKGEPTKAQADSARQPYFVFRRALGSLRLVSASELVASRAVSADSAAALRQELQQMRDMVDQMDAALKQRYPGLK